MGTSIKFSRCFSGNLNHCKKIEKPESILIFTKKSSNMDKTRYESNRNQRAKARDALIFFVNNISIYDMDSVRAQVSMLSMVTSQTDEMTRKSVVCH